MPSNWAKPRLSPRKHRPDWRALRGDLNSHVMTSERHQGKGTWNTAAAARPNSYITPPDDLGNTTTEIQNFNNTAYSWSTRINSKINLPLKIDWQLNGNYDAPQKTAQGRRIGVASANTSLSKDILKERATIGLNIQDIFNSRKMKYETDIPNLSNSYSEMQWRQRQITLSFTYRFNMKKNEKQKQNQQDNGGGDEYMGG